MTLLLSAKSERIVVIALLTLAAVLASSRFKAATRQILQFVTAEI